MKLHSGLVRLFLVPLLLTIGFMVWTHSAPSPAEAAIITVNSRFDDPNDGACSIREAAETLLQWADIDGCTHVGDFDGVTDEIVLEFATACASSTPGVCSFGFQPFTVRSFADAGVATAQTYDGETGTVIDTSFVPPFRQIAAILTSLTLIPPEARPGALLDALNLLDQLLGPGFPVNGATPLFSGFSGVGDFLSE
jgi:hypothetical protein